MKERKTQAHYKKYTTAEQEDEKMRKQNVIIIVHMLLRNSQIDGIRFDWYRCRGMEPVHTKKYRDRRPANVTAYTTKKSKNGTRKEIKRERN